MNHFVHSPANACVLLKADALDLFEPFQFGVVPPQGCEKVIHGLRHCFIGHWSDDSLACMKVDMNFLWHTMETLTSDVECSKGVFNFALALHHFVLTPSPRTNTSTLLSSLEKLSLRNPQIAMILLHIVWKLYQANTHRTLHISHLWPHKSCIPSMCMSVTP